MAADERPERVLLAAGTAYYTHADAVGGMLPEVPKALARVVETLRGRGVVTLASDSLADVQDRGALAGAEGMPPLPDPPGFLLDPAPAALYDALARAATAAPVVIVYYTGHGKKPDRQPYYLIATETDPASLINSALRAGEFPLRLMPPEGADPPDVLVILDCCFSGEGGQESLEAALRDLGNPNVWVLATAGSDEYARQGVFAQAFADALDNPPVGASTSHVPLYALLQTIRDRLPADADQRARIFPPGGSFDADEPPFFPNSDHHRTVAGRTVADQQHWLSRIRGGPKAVSTGVYLTGRVGRLTAATDLAQWLGAPTSSGLAVVTGSPGSGKSTLLAMPVLLTTKAGREVLAGGNEQTDRAGMVDAVLAGLDAEPEVVGVHARGLATDTVAQQIATALGFSATTAAGLLEEVEQADLGDRRIVVVVDAVDEATHPATLIVSLLRPLADAFVKVAIGARPHVLASIADMDLLIDLDTASYQDPEALTDYIAALLTAAHEPHIDTPYKSQHPEDVSKVATALAARATTALPNSRRAESFLLGRLLASTIRRREQPIDVTRPDWLGELPPDVGQAFDEELDRLGPKKTTARVLLSALAWARGPGLPWENIWTPVAQIVAAETGEELPGPLTDEDVRWLLKTCGSYVIEDAGPGGRSAYRLFHDLLAVHLRQDTHDHRHHDPSYGTARRSARQRLHESILDALLETVPLDAVGQRRWDIAHPYLRTYLGEHAALAGEASLDRLLSEPDYLVTADAAVITPLLLGRPRTDRAFDDMIRAYLRARPLLTADPRENKAHLQEAAAVVGSPATQTLLDAGPIAPLFQTVLAPAIADDSLLTLVGHFGLVHEVAFAAGADDAVLLASCGADGTVRLWDPATGTSLGDPLTGHSGAVSAVAFSSGRDGGPLLASGGDDRTVRLWDPVTRASRGHPITGHTGRVRAVAFATGADGALLLASCAEDGTVRLWDPVTGASRGDPLTGHAGRVNAVAFGTGADGALLLASGGEDGTVRLWDPIIGASRGDPLTGHSWGVSALAFGTRADGALLLASGGLEGTVRLWDPATGAPRGDPLTGHTGRVNTVAFGTGVDGALLLASGGEEGTVRLWDPIIGASRGDPLTGHSWGVSALAFGTGAEGALVLASSSDDGTVRLWDPVTSASHNDPLTERPGRVNAVVFGTGPNGGLLAAAGQDGTVRLWNPDTGAPLGHPLTGHKGWVRTVAFGATADGALLLASGGGDDDSTVRVWHPATGASLGDPLTGHRGWVRSVAFGTAADGALLLASGSVDGTVRLWDPETGTSCRDPLTGHIGGVRAVAFGTGTDGTLLLASGGEDGTVRLWDPGTGTSPVRTLSGHTGRVNSLAFGTGADGALLLASGSDDRTVRLWDPISGTSLSDPLTGHTRPVSAVASGRVANGGVLLVSGSEDGTVRLWDPRSNVPTAILRRRTAITGIALRERTKDLAICSYEGFAVVRLT